MACLPHKLNPVRNVVYFLLLFPQKTYCDRKEVNMFTELQVLGALVHIQVFFFTGATTLCVSWPPPCFRNSKSCRSGVVSTTSNTQTRGPETTLCLAWMALPGPYAPASIALRVIGEH
jgi:hypothetical protein